MKPFRFFLLACLLSLSLAISLSAGWKKVYLATYPRSGNHWMRYLIEEATHIATGSTYCDQDPPHLPKRFPWGGYSADHGCEGNCRYPKEKDMVVIKTHYPTLTSELDSKDYKKVIRIVRHPVDSIYSLFVFRKDPVPTTISRESLKHYIKSWRDFQEYWNKQERVYTIRYEDLLTDQKKVLTKVLKTIGYRVEPEDIKRAVKKNPPRGTVLKHAHFFSKSDLQLMQDELKDLLDQFGYEIPIEAGSN